MVTKSENPKTREQIIEDAEDGFLTYDQLVLEIEFRLRSLPESYPDKKYLLLLLHFLKSQTKTVESQNTEVRA